MFLSLPKMLPERHRNQIASAIPKHAQHSRVKLKIVLAAFPRILRGTPC
jgi:hypothetical protein